MYLLFVRLYFAVISFWCFVRILDVIILGFLALDVVLGVINLGVLALDVGESFLVYPWCSCS